jgi:hypothetical protein
MGLPSPPPGNLCGACAPISCPREEPLQQSVINPTTQIGSQPPGRFLQGIKGGMDSAGLEGSILTLGFH